jgi:hypothetical protein
MRILACVIALEAIYTKSLHPDETHLFSLLIYILPLIILST